MAQKIKHRQPYLSRKPLDTVVKTRTQGNTYMQPKAEVVSCILSKMQCCNVQSNVLHNKTKRSNILIFSIWQPSNIITLSHYIKNGFKESRFFIYFSKLKRRSWQDYCFLCGKTGEKKCVSRNIAIFYYILYICRAILRLHIVTEHILALWGGSPRVQFR